MNQSKVIFMTYIGLGLGLGSDLRLELGLGFRIIVQGQLEKELKKSRNSRV